MIKLPPFLWAEAEESEDGFYNQADITLYYGDVVVTRYTVEDGYQYTDSPYADSNLEEFVAGKLREVFERAGTN